MRGLPPAQAASSRSRSPALGRRAPARCLKSNATKSLLLTSIVTLLLLVLLLSTALAAATQAAFGTFDAMTR